MEEKNSDTQKENSHFEDALRLAREIEKGLSLPTTHWGVARAFREYLNSKGELLDPKVRDLLFCDEALFDLMIAEHLPDYRAQWGPLAPKAVFPAKVYPPPIDKFPEPCVAYFRRRLKETELAVSRSRLADFLWLRTKEISYVDEAIQAYLQVIPDLYKEQDVVMQGEAVHYLSRATNLVLSLQRPKEALANLAFSFADEMIDRDLYGWACHVVETTSKVLGQDSNRARKLLKRLDSTAERLALKGGQERHMERSVLDATLQLAAELGEPELARELRIRIARSCEQEADERAAEGGLIMSALLQNALRLYQQLGCSEDVQRTKKCLHDASILATSEMEEVSVQIPFNLEEWGAEIDKWLEETREIAPWAHLLAMGVNPLVWPAWAEVQERATKLAQQFLFQHLAWRTRISPDGRPLPDPEDEEARRELREIDRFNQDLLFTLGLLAIKIQLLRAREAWNVDLIMEAFSQGSLFDEEVLTAVRPGILLYEEGRYWEALHVLVPQIERVIRKLAASLGGDVYTYKSQTGHLEWKTLHSLLKEPSVIEVLDKLGPDSARTLRYVLIDSRSLNIRDDVAHGIAFPGEGRAQDLLALICILALLKLANLRLLEAGEVV